MTSRTPSPIRVAATYDVPSHRVFDAWLDPVFTAQWLFATALQPAAPIEMNPQVAGRFCFLDQHCGAVTAWRGEYVDILPPRRLVFTLQLDGTDAATRVEVTIDECGDGCRLVVAHHGVPAHRAESLANRWTGLLYGLGTLLGADADPFTLAEHER
ncbi:MAG TPA: SRPBCC family protein [Casimicrobiaceae bacterium]|nr:SRPBCC family protein [Casimicrobiaceae bacterium]